MRNVKRRIWTVGLSVIAFLVLLSPRSWAQQKMGDIYGIQYGSPETFAEFHGFVNLEYFDFQHEGQGTPTATGVSSFDLHNFYFNAIAKVRENVLVFGEVEYEHGGLPDGEIKLDRAFIDWRIVDGLSFRLGKFYTPFGLEIKYYQAPVRKLVSRPLITELLYDEWTEVGINAYSMIGPKPLKFTYDLAVSNGPHGLTETDTQNQDNNSQKSFIGRVSLIPHLTEEVFLEIGGSFAYTKYDDASLLTVRHFGADARLRAMGLELVGEYVGRNGNDSSGAFLCGGGACLPARAHGHGYYIQASYRLLHGRPWIYSLEPVVRYDRSDLPDHFVPADPDTVRRRWTFGINYMPYNHFHFKAEYQFVANSGTTNLHDDGVMLAAVADF